MVNFQKLEKFLLKNEVKISTFLGSGNTVPWASIVHRNNWWLGVLAHRDGSARDA